MNALTKEHTTKKPVNPLSMQKMQWFSKQINNYLYTSYGYHYGE